MALDIESAGPFRDLWSIGESVLGGQANWATFAVGAGTFVVIRLLKRFDFISIPVLGGVAVIRNMRTPIGAITINVLDFVKKIHDIPILLVYNDVDVTVGVEAPAFEQLYEKLPEPKSKLHLPGHGHLFDWPNTYTLWGKMFELFEQTLR